VIGTDVSEDVELTVTDLYNDPFSERLSASQVGE
jgi:hypothetical protein